MDKTVLRRLSGEVKQRRFATIDLEARQWVHPYAVGFYDGHSYLDFVADDETCVSDALVHILTPAYSGCWIYAHNGGNYDFMFIVRQLLSDPRLRSRYLVEMTPIGSCIVRIDITERTKVDNKDASYKWSFIDSARLMPLPLKDLGEVFGITKKIEIEMSYDELAKRENSELMRRYLKTDCVSLYEAIERIQDKINALGGQLGVTLPATALDLFRRKFQKDDIATNRHWAACPEHSVTDSKKGKEACKGCMHEFIREAYFGGRSEIFRMKFNPYVERPDEWSEREDHIDRAVMYDFNSHYPNCMLSPMPTGQAIELEGLDEKDILANAKIYTGVVDCEVSIPSDCYLPPLPIRHNGKLIFPVGRLRGVWDASELGLLPLIGGRIHKSYRSLWFENSSVFVRFVKALYQFRNKKLSGWTKGMDWIAKILLNSAYGKFAMKEMRTKILIHPNSPAGLKSIDLDSDVWAEEVHVSPTYIVPQLSVHVTALARVGLWKKLWMVLQKGGRIYYTDTDSVVCSGVELPTSGDLGDLKMEATIRRAEFILPKLYLVETDEENEKKKREKHVRIKAKGMGPGIRIGNAGDDPLDKQLSEKEFVDLVTKGVPIDRHRLTKLREGLNDYAKKALSFPRVVSSPKSLKTQYDKRIVMDDFDTRPLQLEHF